MKIQYYNKIKWGLAPLAPNDAPPLTKYIHYENYQPVIHVRQRIIDNIHQISMQQLETLFILYMK
jgi:hypothetical protein